MRDVINKAKQFKYTSLKHTDKEEISDSTICVNNEESIFLYTSLYTKAKVEWATNSKEDFFKGLKKTLNIISNDQNVKKIDLEFIPKDFVIDMQELGFEITSEWIKEWNNSRAIKLYEGVGYKRKTKRGQINMEKMIK